MPARGAIYIRQSHTEDGSLSLQIQADACTAVAAQHGIPIVAHLAEPPSTSAYRNRGTTRPMFRELITRILASEIDCVIIYRTDRLSRGGGPGYAPLVEAIEAAGHDLDRFVLHPGGWLTEFELGIRAAMDREESSKTSARMRDVRAKEASAGVPRTPGYGYRRDGTQLRIDRAEAGVIRDAARRVLQGETAYAIAADLNNRQIPSARGGTWRTNTLLTILRSPRIAGLREHHGEVVAKGQWEPIITEEMHERLTAVLAQRPGRGPRVRTFPAVGFAFCGKCTHQLRSLADGRRRRYGCRGGEGGGCGGIQIKAEFLEEAIRAKVIAALSDPPTRARLRRPAGDGAALDELDRLQRARASFNDTVLAGHVDGHEANRVNAGFQTRITELRLAIKGAQLDDLPTTAAELSDLWDQATIHRQRQLIALTIKAVTVNTATRKGPGVFDPDRLDWDPR